MRVFISILSTSETLHEKKRAESYKMEQKVDIVLILQKQIFIQKQFIFDRMNLERLEFEPYLSHMVIITLTKLLNPFQPQA